MKTLHLRVLGTALLCGASLPLTAATLLPAIPGDRIPPAPAASKALAEASAGLERQPLALSWKLSGQGQIDSAPAAHVASSREFWIDVSAEQLRQGLELELTAPGAVVRISPVLAERSAPIDPQALQLSRDGQALRNADVIASVLKPSDLQDGAVAFPEGTGAFRLAPGAGSGRFTVRSSSASGRYLVHVLDGGSKVAFNLQAASDTLFAGEVLAASARLEGATATAAQALVSGPDGSTQPLRFDLQRDGSLALRQALQLPAFGASRGLYQLHAWTAGGSDGRILRDVRTAFALAAPTARLSGSYQPAAAAKGHGPAWTFGVVVGSAGRYQLDGVLYVDGMPVAAAQSAAWLEPGQRELALGFDAALFEAGLPARYELRDLRLADQGQLVTLERRALALTAGR